MLWENKLIFQMVCTGYIFVHWSIESILFL